MASSMDENMAWFPQVIVVPGGGLSRDGKLLPWVQERLRRAKAVYDTIPQSSRALEKRTVIITMCEGIRHSVRDPRASPDSVQRSLRLESQLSAQFLYTLGVPTEDVVTDDLSLDTTGNAYFLRTTHTDVINARDMVVVTSEFHSIRAKTVFEKVFSLAPHPDKDDKYNIRFEIVGNHNIEPTALQRRREWEAQQLEKFLLASETWVDLHDVHGYIFGASAATALPKPGSCRELPPSFNQMTRKERSIRDRSPPSRAHTSARRDCSPESLSRV